MGIDYKRMHIFWTWAHFFGPVHVFWTYFFLGPRVRKYVGDLLVCFLDPVVVFFFGTCMYLCWTQGFFFRTAKLIVPEFGFLFFWTRAPASWTLPP